MVEWLKHCAYGQNGLGLKPTSAILLCSWKRHFMALSSCLVVLAGSPKFLLNYKQTAISLHVVKQVGVIAYPMS